MKECESYWQALYETGIFVKFIKTYQKILNQKSKFHKNILKLVFFAFWYNPVEINTQNIIPYFN